VFFYETIKIVICIPTRDDISPVITKEGTTMTSREAIKVLMMSPFYFKLDLVARKTLIKEFCSLNRKRTS